MLTRRLLTALQLGDSALPVGGYALSHGLEQFVHEGWVRDREALHPLLENYLLGQVAPLDGVATASAWRIAGTGGSGGGGGSGSRSRAAKLVALDRLLSAHKLAAEARQASGRTGRRLLSIALGFNPGGTLRTYADAVDAGASPGHHAVVLGAVARAAGLAAEEAVLVLLYSFASGWLGAAQRLLPMDPYALQVTLHDLQPAMIRGAGLALARRPEEMAAGAPLIEAMAMRHERGPVRLFMT